MLFFGVGCSAAFTPRGEVDAGRKKKPGECVEPPTVRCDAGAAVPSCVPDPDAGLVGTLPAPLQVGCEVDFVNPDPLPRSGECYILERCTCQVTGTEQAPDGGAPRPTTAWVCRR